MPDHDPTVKARLNLRLAQIKKRHNQKIDTLKKRISNVSEQETENKEPFGSKQPNTFKGQNLDMMRMTTVKGQYDAPLKFKGINTVMTKKFQKPDPSNMTKALTVAAGSANLYKHQDKVGYVKSTKDLELGEDMNSEEITEDKIKDLIQKHIDMGKSYESAVMHAQNDLKKSRLDHNDKQKGQPMGKDAGVAVYAKKSLAGSTDTGRPVGEDVTVNKQEIEYATDLSDILAEDGHADVASARRKAVLVIEDAMQILMKLKQMDPMDSLPSWWMNKLAVSSSMLDGARNYMVVPSSMPSDSMPDMSTEQASPKNMASKIAKSAVSKAMKDLTSEAGTVMMMTPLMKKKRMTMSQAMADGIPTQSATAESLLSKYSV